MVDFWGKLWGVEKTKRRGEMGMVEDAQEHTVFHVCAHIHIHIHIHTCTHSHTHHTHLQTQQNPSNASLTHSKGSRTRVRWEVDKVIDPTLNIA